jgi:hypothetical protein
MKTILIVAALASSAFAADQANGLCSGVGLWSEQCPIRCEGGKYPAPDGYRPGREGANLCRRGLRETRKPNKQAHYKGRTGWSLGGGQQEQLLFFLPRQSRRPSFMHGVAINP